MYLFFYSIVFITLLYALFCYQNNLVAAIIILAFYSGLAAYPGKFIENPYKIMMLALVVYAAIKYQPFIISYKRDIIVICSFALFSFNFFLAAYINHINLVLTFSQYGKYAIPFIMFFVFKYYQNKSLLAFVKISVLFILLLKIQIVCSFVKFFTLGMAETTVGSVAFMGGGIATILPILGFILIWLARGGNLKGKDWYFVIFLIFIAVVSLKRAIWFILPVLILLFLFYIPKREIPKRFAWVFILIPIIFYFGARINPTLNKEGKTWGSFDFDFVANYVMEYNFGKGKGSELDKKLGQGRGGTTLLLLNKITEITALTEQDIFGYGLDEFVTTDYESFDESKFGVNSKGSVTGFFLTYISFGVAGTLFFLVYVFSILNYIKIKRLKYVVMGLFIWEYFFYIGMIFTTPALTILFFYIIVYLSKYPTVQSLPVINFGRESIKPRESFNSL